MADIFTRRKRSEVMSLIRSAGNKATELRLIRIFRAQGIKGWRRQQVIRFNVQPSTLNPERSKLGVGRRKLSRGVRPDFIFPRSTGSGLRRAKPVAVFVDGCFWHGCPRHGTKPKQNAKFWREKIAGNRARDRRVNCALRKRGWKVMRIWEHELLKNNKTRFFKRLAPLLQF